MTPVVEKTVSATLFKAKCLELIEDMSTGRLRRVHITKRGKPFVSVSPSAASKPSDTIFDVMQGTVHIPAGLDLTAPVIDIATIEAMRDEPLV